MVLPTKIYINFHTQVLNIFSRISGIKITESDKTSPTIKYLLDILKIHWVLLIYVCFQLFYSPSGLKVIKLNEKVQFTFGKRLF